MLIGALKLLFLTSTILFAVLIFFHKNFVEKIKDNVKKSNFVAFIAFSLVAYIVCAMLLAIISGGIKYKILMMFFAIFPFIIGRMATYQKIKLYTMSQILIMLISAIFVCLK